MKKIDRGHVSPIFFMPSLSDLMMLKTHSMSGKLASQEVFFPFVPGGGKQGGNPGGGGATPHLKFLYFTIFSKKYLLPPHKN